MHPTVAKYYNTYESLTDEELDFLIDLHTRLAQDLKYLGPKYNLARTPIVLELEKFESYKRARKS